jgi:hypothetical protein
VNSTLLPLDVYDEVAKGRVMDEETIRQHPAVTVHRGDIYPDIVLYRLGCDGEINELHPTGQMDEPETNLDTAFWSPLMRACEVWNLEPMQLLLEHGANVNYESESGMNALLMITSGRKKIDKSKFVELLIAAQHASL